MLGNILINSREKAFNNINKMIALSRYEIEQRQHIGDYSLNIHGEYFFRDIFNYLYNANFENANTSNMNEASIDLIDRGSKIAYQITTTRSKEKIENTLQALIKPEYSGYTFKIYYLLDKPKPNKQTVADLQVKYSLNILDHIFDHTNLIRDINNLDTAKLIEFDKMYFQGIEEKYTDQIALDLVIKHLIHSHSQVHKSYDDDFGSIDTNQKIILNGLNPRISTNINAALDYRDLMNNIESEGNLLSNLREFIVNDLYKNILHTQLQSKVSKAIYEHCSFLELHDMAKIHKLDFNKIIHNLHQTIEDSIEIKDYNSTHVSWTIIAFFFEICDVGMKQ